MKFFKGKDNRNDYDLTQAVTIARRGLRRDVKILCEALKKRRLFLPLASAIKERIEDGEEINIKKGTQIISHLLPDPEDNSQTFVALFTKEEIVTPVKEALNWQTDGGPLQCCGFTGQTAFELSLDIIENQKLSGLIINPFHESALKLTLQEVKSIAKGEPIPFVHYLSDLPVQENEDFQIKKPTFPIPLELKEAIEKYLASYPEISSYEILEIFNPERDIKPHLALNLRTKGREIDQEEFIHEITLAISEKVPPPGYIDIMFNV